MFEARRKLEDKLEAHRIEWRSFFLPMDLQSVHHNRDMPAGFSLYLCVADTTLPSKGTAYRANRSAGKAGFSKMHFMSFPVISCEFQNFETDGSFLDTLPNSNDKVPDMPGFVNHLGNGHNRQKVV